MSFWNDRFYTQAQLGFQKMFLEIVPSIVIGSTECPTAQKIMIMINLIACVLGLPSAFTFTLIPA